VVFTLDSPVVLKAEVVSKRRSRKSCPRPRSITLIAHVAIKATARRAVSAEISRLKTVMRSCPRTTCTTTSASKAAVVVFTPPPVEAEDVPTNISTEPISLLGSVRDAWSSEAKPAVRKVMD